MITGGSNPDGSGFMYNNWLMLNWDGPAHKCGVTRAGGVLCWGAGGAGQLGQGSYTDSSTPVQIARNLSFVQVAVGAWHACAVDISGGAWCWGWLVHMCGVDGQDVMEVVVGLGGVYPSVVHFMVLTSHSFNTQTFQLPSGGRSGIGNMGFATATPVAVTGGPAPGHAWVQLTVGTARWRGSRSAPVCGLTEEGDAFCWGKLCRPRCGMCICWED